MLCREQRYVSACLPCFNAERRALAQALSLLTLEGLPSSGEYVMVTEDAKTPFSVIGPQKTLPNGLRIYKIFSRQPLEGAALDAIFANLTILADR